MGRVDDQRVERLADRLARRPSPRATRSAPRRRTSGARRSRSGRRPASGRRCRRARGRPRGRRSSRRRRERRTRRRAASARRRAWSRASASVAEGTVRRHGVRSAAAPDRDRRRAGVPDQGVRLDVRRAPGQRGGRGDHRLERRAAHRHHREPVDPDRARRRPARPRDHDLRRDRAPLATGRARPVLPLRGHRRRALRAHLRALHGAVDLHHVPDHGGDVRRGRLLGLRDEARPLDDGNRPADGADRPHPGDDRQHLRRLGGALLGDDVRRA